MTRQRIHSRYDDRTVVSRSGALLLESRHRLSLGMWGLHRTTVALRRGLDVVWSKPWGLRMGSPQDLWLDDSGQCAVLYGDDVLVLVSPDGSIVRTVNLLSRVMGSTTYNRFIKGTTAGSYWDMAPVGSFVSVNGESLFSVRTYFGWRMILAADGQERTDDEAVGAARAAEIDWARATLAGVGQSVDSPARLWRAATLLGVEGDGTAVEALEQAAKVDEQWSRKSTVAAEAITNGGERRPLYYAAYGLRLHAQLALLRLGRTPPRAAPFAFFGADSEASVAPVERPSDWFEAVASLQLGATHGEVLARCGSPTWLDRDEAGEGVFWFDGQGKSRRLSFRRGALVDIALVYNPPWTADLSRELWFFD